MLSDRPQGRRPVRGLAEVRVDGGDVPRYRAVTPPMPLVQHALRELHLKIVYYGPGLGGKTTNLEHIHQQTRPDRRGKLISLMTESERTLFFDLLPLELGSFKGYRVRLHLCTVPGQIALDTTRQLVLRHVDGVVFVSDSQPGRGPDNVQSFQNLATNLALQGDDFGRMPLVLQYNKRDLAGARPVSELRAELELHRTVPEIEASALRGAGVFETLKAITKAALRRVGNPDALPEGQVGAPTPPADDVPTERHRVKREAP